MFVTPGERIMIMRTRQELSKKELAMRAGTTVATITKYERGEVEFDNDIIYAIADVLGVTVNWIQFEFDDPERNKELEALIK